MAKTLVAYFTYSGNAKKVAERVAQLADADMFEIVAKNPYSSDYQTCIEEAKKEVAANARPEITDKVQDMDKYDTIVVGFPNWCSTCPMVVLTFLEQYDLMGKKVYSFVTNGGGGCGKSTEDIAKSAKGAEVTEGINGNDLSDDAIKQWLGL
ncbi:MAG: flavodoxin [Clostridium sp.]|nr:flavodoxin [Clostridium sp.]MCM1172218.1 flavodoxin [Clostridium sp.]MCM1208425.1 flavodoxin [Ruminococcus sp.]